MATWKLEVGGLVKDKRPWTARQNSGSTRGIASTPECLTKFTGMKAQPRPAATIAKVQSSRSLLYTAVQDTFCAANTESA